MKQLKSHKNRTILFRSGDRLSCKEFWWKIQLPDQSHLYIHLGYYIWKKPTKKQWFFSAGSTFQDKANSSHSSSFDKGTIDHARRWIKIVHFERGKLNGLPTKRRYEILESFLKRALKVTKPTVIPPEYADLGKELALTLD